MTAEIHRIHELRQQVQKDVDKELRELDEMGSLKDAQKPLSLLENLTAYDLTSEDTSFILNEIYQFLLFEGETPESKSIMHSLNYEELEIALVDRIQKLQKSTVGKALQRIIKRSVTKDWGTQTPFTTYEEDMKKIKEDMSNLYRDKYTLKMEAENGKKEINKFKVQVNNLNNEISELRRENAILGRNLEGGQLTKKYEIMTNNSDTIRDLNKKIEQYKDILK